MRDVSHSADGANPFVVTLATPFIEIHQANFGRRPTIIRLSLMVVMSFFLESLTAAFVGVVLPPLFPSLTYAYVVALLLMTVVVLLYLLWVGGGLSGGLEVDRLSSMR